MNVNKIEEDEQKFADTLTNISRVKYNVVGETKIRDYSIVKIAPNHDSYYYKTETAKTCIVLHSTAGVLRSDLASLTKKDNHVSVPYIIARNGTIYELFDPKYWSYHLGKGSVGGNSVNSKRSIGIELSNYGPLTKNGNELETIYSRIDYIDKNGKSKKTKKDVYCLDSETEHYTVVEDGFRDKKYFASFTKAQYEALDELLDYLCTEYNIPREFIPYDKRFDVFPNSTDAKTFTGICSHVNFRKSGKWDLGPDFEWDLICDDNDIILEEVNITSTDETEDIPNEKVETSNARPVTPKASSNRGIFSLVSKVLLKLFKK